MYCFAGLLVRRAAGRRAELMYIGLRTSVDLYISTILESTQQQSCMQFKRRASKTIQDANSAFSPDLSVLSIWSSAQLLRGCSAADVSPG